MYFVHRHENVVSVRLYIVARAAKAICSTPCSRVVTFAVLQTYRYRSTLNQVKKIRALELRDVRRGTYSACRAWPGLLDEVRDT